MHNLNFKKIFFLFFFNCFFAGIFLTLSAQVVNFSEVYQKTVLGAVFIATDKGSGSGFQINSDGYIVTNHHVINGAQGSSIFVYFYSGEKFAASIIASNPVVDLALLKIQANSNGIIPILPTGDVQIGSAVMAIGRSKIDDYFSQQPGSVNNLGNDHLIHHNASITYGFSGGPLIDQEGYLVGVNCSGFDIEKERNFAIKASYLRNFLSSVGVNYSTRSLRIAQPGNENRTESSGERRVGYGTVTFYSTYGGGGNIYFKMNGQNVGTLTKHHTGQVSCEDKDALTIYKQPGNYVVDAYDEAGHTWNFVVTITEGHCSVSRLICLGCRSTKKSYIKSRRYEDEYPTRIAFKFGGGGQYYMMPVEATKRYPENNYTAKDISWMTQASIGYRLGVNPETNRGQIVGFFANVGNQNDRGIRRLALDQKVVEGTQKVDFKNINLYKELEAGFVFGEWFRLTGGGGMQDIHFADGRTKTLKYFSATSGFCMRIGTAFEWDVNATFMFPGEFAHPSYRINTSLNIRFKAFRF